MKSKVNRFFAYTTLILGILMIALILVSWFLAAVKPESEVRSMLGSEGIRWFFSSFVGNLTTPWLVWLVLSCITIGAVSSCGIFSYLASEFRQRVALWLVVIEFMLFVVIMMVLTLIPHAILLSVTGHLFPSSFTQSIFPYICFALCTMSVSFAGMSGRTKDVTDVFNTLTCGFKWLAPLLAVYVFLVQLVCSFLFVFGECDFLVHGLR